MINIEEIDFEKSNGLVPAIIQDFASFQVLMVGYMNREALEKTIQSEKVTFFSRSKNRLWTKGETSGNFLEFKDIAFDCDSDALLIKAKPLGNTCHLDRYSCFGNREAHGFLHELEQVIRERKESAGDEKSYTKKLFAAGVPKIAQKVGEEAVELVIEAMQNDSNLFLNEAADLMYHFIVLLQAKGHTLEEVENLLMTRHQKK